MFGLCNANLCKTQITLRMFQLAYCDATANDPPDPPDRHGRRGLPCAVYRLLPIPDTARSLRGLLLLQRWQDQLAAYPSLQTKLRVRGEVFGRATSGSGTYLQQGGAGSLRYRLQWQVQVDQIRG